MSPVAHEFRHPSPLEQDAARQLRRILATQQTGHALRVLSEGDRKPAEITLTPALSALLIEFLDHIGRGEAVTMLPVGKMLSTQQAADILNVSRPYLIGLLEEGELPFSLVGRHRRIRSDDLFAYKSKRDDKRGAALSELARVDGENF